MNLANSKMSITSVSDRRYEMAEEVRGDDAIRRFKGRDQETGEPVMLVVPNVRARK